MLTACARDFNVLLMLNNHLGADHDFLLAVAAENVCFILALSHELQLQFPDVVDCALRTGREHFMDYDHFVNSLAPELWNNRDFVLNWFRLGHPFVDCLQLELKADKEIFLLSAKHCDPYSENKYETWGKAAQSLLRDKKFMLQILEIDSPLGVEVDPELRNDSDLCLLAFSNESAARSEVSIRRQRSNEYDYLEEFRSLLLEHLNAHRIFSTVVLPAMSQCSGCTLAVLNQGAETSRSYRMRVAEYLDIPTGERLRMHRQALNNLDNVLDGDRRG